MSPIDERPAGQAHPTQSLDDTVHQRTRLGALAVLHESAQAEFTFLREALDLTAGNLSRHLQVLEEAGLVEVDKGYEGRRPRTWVRITKAGRRAFLDEIAQLKELIRRVDDAAEGPDRG
ncbi:DNA-binding MarR family transcriptional regulator [Streptacidiphilus sp. MAP12-33]|uniref:winged helix-turn-helix domain-containing protein n=1 Tax=Streptacidiphilus sp. MAP12-33 TaxID=3156266 RepID=UPI0035175AE1